MERDWLLGWTRCPTLALALWKVWKHRRQGSTTVFPVACLSRHLFAIANLAFAKMLDAKQNQCIIIR